jgi:hypothetical protein
MGGKKSASAMYERNVRRRKEGERAEVVDSTLLLLDYRATVSGNASILSRRQA